jgi:subtilisin family serine protease
MTIAEAHLPDTAHDSFSEAPDTLPEKFSSDGPCLRFYAHDGSAFTPYDLTSRYGGKLFWKPDFAAAGCVHTDVPKFESFCGTSAAAPHAAAIAALVWSNFPQFSASDVHRVLLQSALPPTSASGVSPVNHGWVPGGGENAWSETLGFGILMADRSLAAASMLPYSDFLGRFLPNKDMVDLMLSTTSFASGSRDGDPARSFGMTLLTKDKQVLLFYRYNVDTQVRGMTPDTLGNGPPVITDPISVTMNGFETTVRNSDGTEVRFNGLDVYNQFLRGGGR